MKKQIIECRPSGELAIRLAVWSAYKPLERTLVAILGSLVVAQSAVQADGDSLSRVLRERDIEVLVADVDRSSKGAGQFISRIIRAVPDIKIIALSAYSDHRLVTRALESGAIGYVLKDFAFEDIFNAVRAVARNQRFLSPAIKFDEMFDRAQFSSP